MSWAALALNAATTRTPSARPRSQPSAASPPRRAGSHIDHHPHRRCRAVEAHDRSRQMVAGARRAPRARWPVRSVTSSGRMPIRTSGPPGGRRRDFELPTGHLHERDPAVARDHTPCHDRLDADEARDLLGGGRAGTRGPSRPPARAGRPAAPPTRSASARASPRSCVTTTVVIRSCAEDAPSSGDQHCPRRFVERRRTARPAAAPRAPARARAPAPRAAPRRPRGYAPAAGRARATAEALEPAANARAALGPGHAAEPQPEGDVLATVMSARRGCWNTAAIRRRSASECARSTGRPWKRTSPCSRALEKPGTRRRVDLPLPFGPMTASTSPASTASAGHVEHGRGHRTSRAPLQVHDGRSCHAGSTWIDPRWIESSQWRSRSISRISYTRWGTSISRSKSPCAGAGLVEPEPERPHRAEVGLVASPAPHEVHVVGDVRRAPVLPDQPHVFRPDEEGDRAVGGGQIGARRRVHRLQVLPAPTIWMRSGAALTHGAAQHVTHAR